MPTPFLGESENSMQFIGSDGLPFTAAKDMLPQDFVGSLQNPLVPANMSPMPPAAPVPVAPEVANPGPVPSPLPSPDVPVPFEQPAPMAQKAPGELQFSQAGQPAAIQMQPAVNDSMKAFNQGLETQMSGAQKSMEAGQRMANAQMAFADQMQKNMLERQQRVEAEQKAIQEHVAGENSKLAEMTRKFQEQGSVDPNRYWNNKSFGNKVVGMLGIALSGIGSGLTGQPNMAVKMIDNLIERDINAQKDALEKSRSAISAQQSLVGNLRSEFSDKMQADAAAYRTMYDVAEMKLKQMMAGSQNLQAQAEGQKVLGELQMKKAQYEMAFKQLSAKQFNDNQIRQGLPIRDPLTVDEKQRDKLVRIGSNDYRMATNEESAKALNKQLPALDSALAKMKRLKEISEFEVLPTKTKGELESLKTQIILDLKNAEALGALDKGAVEVADDIIGDPTTFFQGKSKAQLQSLMDTYLEKKQGLLETNLPYYKRLPSPERGK